MGRRRKGSRFRRYGLPLIAAAALAGCAAFLLLIGPSSTRSPASHPVTSLPAAGDASATPAPEAGGLRGESVGASAGDLDRLAAVLAPAARWRVARSGVPALWEGRIEEGETLVHWNARVTAGIERAGLEVLEASEELLQQRGRIPLQRLTMRVGSEGRALAEVRVEALRAAELPPAF